MDVGILLSAIIEHLNRNLSYRQPFMTAYFSYGALISVNPSI